jgi:methylmalonyl-CoA/ethylmalonyl-CoA epimerase
MKILNIDHIGIAAKSIDEAAPCWTGVLGISAAGKETVSEQKVVTLFLPVGGSELEVLESTAPDGAIAKFIGNRGEGVHHIALRVDDIDAALIELREKGIRLIDEKPRYGAGGAMIAFIHPQSTHGILLELVERREENPLAAEQRR